MDVPFTSVTVLAGRLSYSDAGDKMTSGFSGTTGSEPMLRSLVLTQNCENTATEFSARMIKTLSDHKQHNQIVDRLIHSQIPDLTVDELVVVSDNFACMPGHKCNHAVKNKQNLNNQLLKLHGLQQLKQITYW